MNVGRRVDYALRALCYLAAQPSDRVVPRSEIEAGQAVPGQFLSKILRRLVAAGLLESVPGAHGGFRLGRPAEQISVRDVYECIEGSLCLIECLDRRDAFCCFAGVCTQIDVWQEARRRLSEYLSSVSLRQIADRDGLVYRLERVPDGSADR